MMKKICMLGLVLTFCCLFVFSAYAAQITPGQENTRRTINKRISSVTTVPKTKIEEPCVVMNDGSIIDIRVAKYESTKPLLVASGIGGFTEFWEIRLNGRNVPAGGRAKIVLPYPNDLNQSSAQGRFITIEHDIHNAMGVATGEYEIFSNDGTIANRKVINLIPAGIEIEVSSFSPFYMKTSTTPQNPINNANLPKTGDKGLSLGMWVVCLTAAFAGLMIIRNRKNKK